MGELDDATAASWETWDEVVARHLAAGALHALRRVYGWQAFHLRCLVESTRLFPDVPYNPTRRGPDGSPIHPHHHPRRPMATKAEGQTPADSRWPSDPQACVAAKLAHVQARSKQVEKTGQHKQGYRYMQEHKLIEQLKPLLAEVNASIRPGLIDSVTVAVNPASAKHWQLTTITSSVVFQCGDTGGQLIAGTVGQGEDAGDKGAGKAMTYAFKYGLQKLGLIPTEEILDADDDDEQPAAPAQAPGGQAPAAAAAGEERIGTEKAKQILAILQREVEAQHLDPNKVKGKVATFRVPWSVEGLAQLTNAQKTQLAEWVGKEVHRATQPADGVPA